LQGWASGLRNFFGAEQLTCDLERTEFKLLARNCDAAGKGHVRHARRQTDGSRMAAGLANRPPLRDVGLPRAQVRIQKSGGPDEGIRTLTFWNAMPSVEDASAPTGVVFEFKRDRDYRRFVRQSPRMSGG